MNCETSSLSSQTIVPMTLTTEVFKGEIQTSIDGHHSNNQTKSTSQETNQMTTSHACNNPTQATTSFSMNQDSVRIRRRYKKLLKRATLKPSISCGPGKERTGLLTKIEWAEFVQGHLQRMKEQGQGRLPVENEDTDGVTENPTTKVVPESMEKISSIGPTIRLRKAQNISRLFRSTNHLDNPDTTEDENHNYQRSIKTVEGSHQRDLVGYIIDEQQDKHGANTSNKKQNRKCKSVQKRPHSIINGLKSNHKHKRQRQDCDGAAATERSQETSHGKDYSNDDNGNHRKNGTETSQQSKSLPKPLQCSLPTWATIHNPGAIEQLAVLEISVPSTTDSFDYFSMIRSSLLSSSVQSSNSSPKFVTEIPTRWFQGPTPRSLSESLLYVQQQQQQQHSQSPQQFKASSNSKSLQTLQPKSEQLSRNDVTQRLLERLQSLIVGIDEWSNEAFPVAVTKSTTVHQKDESLDQATMDGSGSIVNTVVSTSTTIISATELSNGCTSPNSPATNSFRRPSSFCFEEASGLVENYGVRVLGQNKLDDQLYVSTPDLDNTREFDSTDNNKNKFFNANVTNDNKPIPRVFGLDCEMVQTAMGSELARISLVQFVCFDPNESNASDDKDKNNFKNHNENVLSGLLTTITILDEFVMPQRPILDYVTEHSGITPKKLQGVTITLKHIQACLASLLKPYDILIGHSIENDLHACHYIHAKIIDTALLFRRPPLALAKGASQRRGNGGKFSLRHLVSALLQRTIQHGSHCSEQDAICAMELAVRRAWIGPSFGTQFTTPTRCRAGAYSLLHDAANYENHSGENNFGIACIGPLGWLSIHVTNQPNAIHAIPHESITDCCKAMGAWLRSTRSVTPGPSTMELPQKRAQLVWTLVNVDEKKTENRDSSEQSQKKESSSCNKKSTLSSSTTTTTQIEQLQHFLSELVTSIGSTTLLLVAVQQNYFHAKRIGKKRRACQDPRATLCWSKEQEDEWNQAVDKCRWGTAFWVGATNSVTSLVETDPCNTSHDT